MGNCNYSASALFEYLPVRYSANSEQRQNRQEVYDFKDGRCSSRVSSALIERINAIVSNNPYDWVVAFIPASTSSRTDVKYGNLAHLISRSVRARVSLTAIFNAMDRESTMKTGKIGDPTQTFGFNSSEIFGKNVLLIDDVITTGRSFLRCADKLSSLGAKSVYGLFVAKTVNPDWN